MRTSSSGEIVNRGRATAIVVYSNGYRRDGVIWHASALGLHNLTNQSPSDDPLLGYGGILRYMSVSTPGSPLDEMNAGTTGIARVWSPHGARLTPYWYFSRDSGRRAPRQAADGCEGC
jgi:hypothetical protein